MSVGDGSIARIHAALKQQKTVNCRFQVAPLPAERMDTGEQPGLHALLDAACGQFSSSLSKRGDHQAPGRWAPFHCRENKRFFCGSTPFGLLKSKTTFYERGFAFVYNDQCCAGCGLLSFRLSTIEPKMIVPTIASEYCTGRWNQ